MRPLAYLPRAFLRARAPPLRRGFARISISEPSSLASLTSPPPDGVLPLPGHSGATQTPSGEVPVGVAAVDVFAAAARLRGALPRTPVTHARKLSSLLGVDLFFKHEQTHVTGSFKERGARNALLLLSPEAAKRGVAAASAGNHALALAHHGRLLGVPVTVVMPLLAPLTKVQNCRDLGARVLVSGEHIGEAREAAFALAESEGLTYINGFDHPHIIAGAGTLGLEAVEQLPDVDAVVVPVGGAGLIAGVALALKTLAPRVAVIGVEPANCPSLGAALAAGRPVTVPAFPTLADGLLVPRVGTNAFAIAERLVDRVVAVKEAAIALAMLRLVETEKVVVEGGGAAGLAALLAGALPELAGKRVLVPLCGGNIDTPVLGRVLERGLAADGRLIKFEARVSDRPGGIAALTHVLADAGVSVREIFHERAWVVDDAYQVRVKLIVETSTAAAGEAMFALLKERGYAIDRPVTGA